MILPFPSTMTAIFLWIILSLAILGEQLHAQDDPLRTTTNGMVRGRLTQSRFNKSTEYYEFLSIPYAQPPVGKLRFQEPLPAAPWEGIKDVRLLPRQCVQMRGDMLLGREDCLYLQVIEPKTARKNQALLPVLVWIHGGAFVAGGALDDGPEYFMELPIVLVVLQYRLNVFGFLTTGDENAKGNNGLKDQALALKWVQKNIRNFGGNPDSVTIFGCSAGGASVQYQVLSKQTKGLFHRAISQSGSSFNRWTFQSRPLERTRRLAEGLGIDSTDTREIVEELQKVNYISLLTASINASIVGPYLPYYARPFTVSIEAESETAFISESTFEMVRRGEIANRVPYIVGYNTEEGTFPYYYIHSSAVDIEIYERYPELLIPVSMNLTKGDKKCYNIAINEIKRYCFRNGSVTDKVNWINYMSQDLFLRGILKYTQLAHKLQPLYLYRFSYTGNDTSSFLGGAGHGADIRFLFPPRFGQQDLSESDKLTIKRLVILWTNFAATGNPTPERSDLLQGIVWPKVDESRPFVDIGDDLIVGTLPDEEYFQFWEQLFGRCGNPPYETY